MAHQIHELNIYNTDFKGTKGEWIARTGFMYDVVTNDDKSFGICVIGSPSELLDAEYQREEADANAKLISAAPDLLKACDEMLQYWLGTYGPSEGTEFAEAAIKKALGK